MKGCPKELCCSCPKRSPTTPYSIRPDRRDRESNNNPWTLLGHEVCVQIRTRPYNYAPNETSGELARDIDSILDGRRGYLGSMMLRFRLEWGHRR